ncbi:MAG: hypothetical protein JXO48_11085 [Deltaproteobacteria bacterium]|nr:hypothetical protein [Deltaproteobacteria bacterium]
MIRDRYPLPQFGHLAQRVQQGSLLQKNRHWTGNDDFEHHYHIAVPLDHDPLYLHLSWKRHADGAAEFIGIFKLHIGTLLQEGYIRQEGGGKVRLRIFHGSDDVLYIQTRSGKPALAIGELRG